MPEETFDFCCQKTETGINSMNAPIQLLGQGNTAGALFSGYPEKVEIKEERGYRIADIQAVSGTILLDQKKSNRVFQKKVQTYRDCQCRNSRYRSLRLHTAGERHANRRDTDTVSGNRLEISEKNGVPAWASISAGYQLLLSPFTLDCRKVKKGNWEKSFPVISVLMGDIMQSVENALLIGKISFVMMLLRGQSLSLGTG